MNRDGLALRACPQEGAWGKEESFAERSRRRAGLYEKLTNWPITPAPRSIDEQR